MADKMLSHFYRGQFVAHTTTRQDGPIVLGCNGSETSIRAITAASRLAGGPADVILVCAIRAPSPPPRPTRLHDALKAEAYLLTDRATVDEVLRRSAEVALVAGLRPLAALYLHGDPVRVLLSTAERYQSPTIIAGMNGQSPSRLVRRLARRLSSDVALIATDGTTHLRSRPASTTQLRNQTKAWRAVHRPANA
ncbi:universal stress protein [Williamsia muralis]|uniref:Universal stress protein n=1 Tax=Williamsia marianensis TaxID=85044 RepID=A0ABU4EPV5_WILMA|nr:universal stress protein [Williamsia muralis]MDV7133248.1 universal stress protein [Williamsia muralis]